MQRQQEEKKKQKQQTTTRPFTNHSNGYRRLSHSPEISPGQASFAKGYTCWSSAVRQGLSWQGFKKRQSWSHTTLAGLPALGSKRTVLIVVRSVFLVDFSQVSQCKRLGQCFHVSSPTHLSHAHSPAHSSLQQDFSLTFTRGLTKL